MTKRLFSFLTAVVTLGLVTVPVYAHVVVKPDTVGVAARQVFTMSVPTEKDTPTIALKLMIPDGLTDVTPNVKPGWKIDVKKTGTGDDAKVTEIDWTDGSIPVGERDEFSFQAQAPSAATTLTWKAYQTYQDGTLVSWDQDPNAKPSPMASVMAGDDDGGMTPYSQTKVVNDLVSASAAPAVAGQNPAMMTSAGNGSLIWVMSVAALALAATSLVFSLRKK